MAYGDRVSSEDITSLGSDQTRISGVWANSQYMWIPSHFEGKVYVFDRNTKANIPARTRTMPSGEQCRAICGFGNTLYYHHFIRAGFVHSIRAFNSSDLTDDSTKTIPSSILTAAGNGSITGITTDGTTVWVSDGSDVKLYAYNLSTKTHDSSKDFNNTISGFNTEVAGIHTDGTTMWIIDDTGPTEYIRAYNLATKTRDSAKDIAISSNETRPRSLYSDGEFMYIGNYYDPLQVFAYDAFPGGSLNFGGNQFTHIHFRGHSYTKIYLGPKLIWKAGTLPVITAFTVDRNNLDLDTATGNIELIVRGTGFTNGRIVNQNTGEVVQNFATNTGVSRASTPIPQEVTTYVASVRNATGTSSRELTVNVTKNPLLTNFRSLGALPSQGNQRHFRFTATVQGVPQPTMSANQGIGTITPRHLTKTGPGIWTLEFDHVFGVAGSRRVTLTITNSSGSDTEFVDIVVP